MNQNEVENNEKIKTAETFENKNDGDCSHTESSLTDTTTNQQYEQSDENVQSSVSGTEEATTLMLDTATNDAKCNAELETSKDNSPSTNKLTGETMTTPKIQDAKPPPHLNHVSSAPQLGSVQLRTNQEQQQKIKSYHDAKQTALWDTTSISTGGTILKGSTCSIYGTPRMARKSSDCVIGGNLPRRVSFPKSDHELVTGYLEPANPWEHVTTVNSVTEIADLYKKSCHKHNTKPLPDILEHLKSVDLKNLSRQPLLSLKNTKLMPEDCEALEEILKRVHYKCIDLSSCDLEECAVSALFEIIEYYEATNELNISSNPRGLTIRGWSSCSSMVGRSQALQLLNAEGNPISKSSAESLGNALCTSNLHTVKLEHCGLKGLPLNGLCTKLRYNRVLKELWLAHNDLDSRDAENIAELLKVNHFLELIDISNNRIGDEGLKHIVEALIVQSKELERRSMFQRTAAIEDDIFSPVDPAAIEESLKAELPSVELSTEINVKNVELNNQSEADKTSNVLIPGLEDFSLENEKKNQTTLPSPVDENETEDDTDDTLKSNTVKTKAQSLSGANISSNSSSCGGGGQSMLDKLLSMNSDSSSEECASNFSTDTIAACSTEEASFVSNDIFDMITMTATNMRLDDVTEKPTLAPASVESVQNVDHTERCAEKVILCDMCLLVANIDCKCDGNNSAIVKIEEGDDEKTLTESTELQQSNNNMSKTNNNNNNINVNNSTNNNTNNTNNNNNNNNNNSNIVQNHHQQQQQQQENCQESFKVKEIVVVGITESKTEKTPNSTSDSAAFEFTADDSDCLIPCTSNNKQNSLLLQEGSANAAADVNKNSRLTEDYDDTHSTDSAFESASEGDISRHLPDEFCRFSTSLESTRLDEIAKETTIETGTIVTESTEFLVEATAITIPKQPLSKIGTQKSDEIKTKDNVEVRFAEPLHVEESKDSQDQEPNTLLQSQTQASDYPLPKVTIETESVSFTKLSDDNSPIPTPPPPSTSPGGAGLSMRRTDSSCNFITHSTRNHSQSSDSLCSDNSLDGSVSSDINLSSSNDRFTKNDTLTRQQRQLDTPAETGTRTPGGLKALAVWNNNLTKESGLYIADLLTDTSSLELLNIGRNILSNEFIFRIKESLTKNTTLTTLGLQSAHLSAKGIETLAEILSFGGNSTLQRIDIRDNRLESESLATLAEALRSNTTVTQIDIDDEPKKVPIDNDSQVVQYTKEADKNAQCQHTAFNSMGSSNLSCSICTIRSMCSRNEKTQAQLQAEKTANSSGTSKRRGGYYVGSRKISLTCHSRPLIECSAASAVAMPPPTNKLEVKRKTGVRLRSPVPSPPTVSPSSSPNRSRFQVFRVTEVSPLTSPLAHNPPPAVHVAITASNSVSIPTLSTGDRQQRLIGSSAVSLTASTSLPSMATATSSTQTIKRPTSSRSSRFHVSKIYEDPKIPLAKRCYPPITPPIHLPPSPMIKSAPKSDIPMGSNNKTIDNEDENSSQTENATLTNVSQIKNDAENEVSQRSIRCPIAIFNENDITLTHDTANVMQLTATTLTSADNANNSVKSVENTPAEDGNKNAKSETPGIDVMENPSTEQITRKLSCPTAVDKLLTLFNPAAIFQRSTSPEPPKNLSTTTNVKESTNFASGTLPTAAAAAAPTIEENYVVKESHPSWTKLGSDILNLSVAVSETERTMAMEQPRSFLNAASKQLRDLGKQVFRQTIPTISGTENDTKNTTTATTNADNADKGNSGGDNTKNADNIIVDITTLNENLNEKESKHNLSEIETQLTQITKSTTTTTTIEKKDETH